MNIYFAAPLFTSAERNWNSLLANNLRAQGHNVSLPQEFCKGMEETAKIAALCLHNLSLCDIIVVCCDGADVDSGTAMECGVAVEQDKKIIAYRTDFRGGGDCTKNMNLMIAEWADACFILPLAGYSEVGRAILGAIERWK